MTPSGADKPSDLARASDPFSGASPENATLDRAAGPSGFGPQPERVGATGALASPLWLVAALALCQFAANRDRNLLSALSTPVKLDLGLSDTRLGLLLGPGFAVLYALALVPAGALADRWDRRRLLLAGLLVWSAGVGGLALASNFWTLLLASLSVGLGQGVVLPCALSLMSERVPPAVQGRATGLFTSASLAGRASAAIGAGWLLLALGASAGLGLAPWRVVVGVALLLNLLPLALLLVTPSSAPVAPVLTAPVSGAPVSGAPAKTGGSLRPALRVLWAARAAFAPLLVFTAANILAVQGVAAWTPAHLHRAFALDAGAAALATGLVTASAGVAGHWLGGWGIDWARRRRGVSGVFGVGAAAQGAALAPLVLFAHAPGLGSALVGLALFALSLGAATPVTLALLQASGNWKAGASGARMGAVSGVVLALTTLCGTGIGPLLIGVLSDKGRASAEGLGAALVAVVAPVLALGLLAALRGAWVLRRTSRFAAPRLVPQRLAGPRV